VPFNAPRAKAGLITHTVFRRSPVLFAALVALVQVLSLGGLYYPDTTQFLRHTFYANEIYKPFDNYVSPAYPLFLDAICLVDPPWLRMCFVVAIQQATVVANVYMTSRIGEMLGRPWVGWCAAWLTALYLPIGLFAQTAQTESLYIFYVVFAAFLLVKGTVQGSTVIVLGSGAMAAMALAQRSVGISVAASVLAATWLARGNRRLWITACFLSSFLAVIGAFVVKNHYQYGRTNLVAGTGIHLFGRVAMVDRSLPDTPQAREILEVGREAGLASVLFDNAGWILFDHMTQAQGRPGTEADDLLRTVALQTFAADPLRTARMTIWSMGKIVETTWPIGAHLWCFRPEDYPWKREEIERYLGRMRDVLPMYPPQAKLGDWPFDLMSWWEAIVRHWRGEWILIAMFVACVAGLLLRDRWILLFSLLSISQIAASAMGDQPVPRYLEPSMIPFFLATLLLASEAQRRLRSRGEARGARTGR
jgi:hypothetical protein